MELRNFCALKKVPHAGLSIAEERKRWLKEFLKAFFAVFIIYAAMYLIRNNLKAAGPLLMKQYGFTTSQLGFIGVGFSFTYAIGKTVLGYFVDGRNAKKFISIMLMVSSIIVFLMGLWLLIMRSYTPALMVMWALSGFCQAPGGPASYSTISRWTPETKRGRWLGFWNVSHNIGGAFAGILALWGANIFFGGNAAGMFIVPAVVAFIISIFGMKFGKDDPEELGWDPAPVIWGEDDKALDEERKDAEELTKWQVFVKYVLRNQWVWMLAIANIFIYIVRIGIDNWVPIYSEQVLGFTNAQAVNTLFFFEMGALVGSLSWGWLSDLLKGRRMVTALISVVLELGAIFIYSHTHSVIGLYAILAVLGWLVFGPQLLIGVSVVGFVPGEAISVTNGITGTCAYLFGDSLAKAALGVIADSKGNGLNFLGFHLQGWDDVFTIFYISLLIGGLLMLIVAFAEEKRIRALEKANKAM